MLGVDVDEPTLGLIEAPRQDEAPDFEIARMRGVHAVAVMFECCPRCVERLRRPAKVARGERDLGFRDDAPRASYRLSRTECPSSISHESFRADEIPELRHRDASKGERGRVVAQRYPVQRPKRVTCRERAPRCRYQ